MNLFNDSIRAGARRLAGAVESQGGKSNDSVFKPQAAIPIKSPPDEVYVALVERQSVKGSSE